MADNANDWHQAAKVYREISFPASLWNSSFKESKRRYRGIMRAASKLDRFSIAQDCEDIATCLELARWLQENTELQNICGKHFRGHETEFSKLGAVAQFFALARKKFGSRDVNNGAIQKFLLEAPEEMMDQIVRVSRSSELPSISSLLEKMHIDGDDVAIVQGRLEERYSKIAEIKSLCDSLKLKDGIGLGSIPLIQKELSAWIGTSIDIEANDEARRILGRHWNVPEQIVGYRYVKSTSARITGE